MPWGWGPTPANQQNHEAFVQGSMGWLLLESIICRMYTEHKLEAMPWSSGPTHPNQKTHEVFV